MKKILTGLFVMGFLTIILNTTSQAQDRDKNLGIGVIVGEPTGLSLKSWTGEENAFDLGLAWSLGRYDAINIHGDYLWHNYDVFEDIDSGSLPFYYGVGGRVIFADDYNGKNNDEVLVGVRIPLGLNYLFEDAPVGIFLEIAPVVNLTPDTDFDLDGGVGVRFYL